LTVLNAAARAYDYLGRWGGDEFLLLCPELDAENSLVFAERIRQTFADASESKEDKITLSIGISTLKVGKPQSREELLDLADKALYKAKRKGRNTVVHESLEHEHLGRKIEETKT
jgi:diguanylate cyclase (GGDEF)-like protein